MSTLFERNYITKLRAWGDPAADGNHSDAFTVRDFKDAPGRQLLVRNDGCDCNSDNDTDAFFIQTYSGDIANLTAEGNLLEGEGHQLVLGAGFNHMYSNVRAINNRMSGTRATVPVMLTVMVQAGPRRTTTTSTIPRNPTTEDQP